MSNVIAAWVEFSALLRARAFWPTTVNPCECGVSTVVNGYCLKCNKDRLAAIVGPELADKADKAILSTVEVWAEIKAAAEAKK